MSINMIDGDTAGDTPQQVSQADVDTFRDWCPHMFTLLAVYHREKEVGQEAIIRKADVKAQINDWLSDHKEYDNVDYSLRQLESRYGYLTIEKPSERKTNCRLTPTGREIAEWFKDDIGRLFSKLGNDD